MAKLSQKPGVLNQPQMLHVWSQHVPATNIPAEVWDKCRQRFHTWSIWDLCFSLFQDPTLPGKIKHKKSRVDSHVEMMFDVVTAIYLEVYMFLFVMSGTSLRFDDLIWIWYVFLMYIYRKHMISATLFFVLFPQKFQRWNTHTHTHLTTEPHVTAGWPCLLVLQRIKLLSW